MLVDIERKNKLQKATYSRPLLNLPWFVLCYVFPKMAVDQLLMLLWISKRKDVPSWLSLVHCLEKANKNQGSAKSSSDLFMCSFQESTQDPRIFTLIERCILGSRRLEENILQDFWHALDGGREKRKLSLFFSFFAGIDDVFFTLESLSKDQTFSNRA